MSARKVIVAIAHVKGLKTQNININDYLEEDLDMDDIDIDEVLEMLSDHFDIDLGRSYDYDDHKQVKDIVKLVTDQQW